ncbi:MAG: GNAT family N-acetyltransferase [Hasllibacter sp.]
MIRRPAPGEAPAIAALWHAVWHETHGPLVPISLTQARTPDEFHIRTYRMLADMRLTGPEGAPTGLCVVTGDELDQLYLARDARGTGAADALMADALDRLRANGAHRAWLIVAQRNDRAAAFYERHGWERTATGKGEVRLASGLRFPLKTWRYERDL